MVGVAEIECDIEDCGIRALEQMDGGGEACLGDQTPVAHPRLCQPPL